MPNRADLQIYQGDDYSAVVMVTNTLPPDQIIAGYSAQAQIRTDCADCDPDVTVEIGCSVQTPYVYLTISKSDTLKLSDQDNDYVWDLEITSPGGIVTTILAGKVKVTHEVTRPIVARAAA